MIHSFLFNLKEIYFDIAPYMFLGLAFSGLLHMVFKKDFIVKHLGENNFLSVLKASIMGVPLPLCSCGVIPTALYLRKQKASQGSTVSFLISTPQTGVDSIIATYGMMGPVFAIFRPIAAFIMGIVGGVAANLLLKEKKTDIENISTINVCSDNQNHSCSYDNPSEVETISQKIINGMKYAFGEFLDDISFQLIVGIVLAAIISFAIPDEFFVKYGGNGLPGMLLMMLFAIPLYVCATASIPIAVSLILKGISPGAALVFLITGPATNIATITLLGRALGRKTIIIYLSVIAIMAVIAGYVLNGFFYNSGYTNLMSGLHKHNDYNLILTLSTAVFSLLLILSIIRKIKGRFFFKSDNQEESMFKDIPKKIKITGMTCNHCVSHVKTIIDEIPGVKHSSVSLNDKSAEITGEFNMQVIIDAINKAGYKAE